MATQLTRERTGEMHLTNHNTKNIWFTHDQLEFKCARKIKEANKQRKIHTQFVHLCDNRVIVICNLETNICAELLTHNYKCIIHNLPAEI